MINSQKLGTAELLFRSARHMGLRPSWVTPGGLFVITTVDGDKYISSSRSPLNSHVSASLVKNKYHARLIMERHELPNIPFARPQTHAQATAFLNQHAKIIVKPVKGSGSHDIHIISDMAELGGIDITKYIFEKYIAGSEVRYLVLGSRIIAVHESEYGTSVEATRALERISYCENDWDPVLTKLSLRIAALFGLQFAAVDYLIDAKGQAHILEVNTTPGLKWFHAPTAGPPVNVAALFLAAVMESIDPRAVQPSQAAGIPISLPAL